MKVKSPSPISVSTVLVRARFGRYTERYARGTAFGGFRCTWTIDRGVQVTWRAGSDLDTATDQERDEQRVHMIGLYAEHLSDQGYTVKNHGHALEVTV